jgi:predicted esterase
MKNFLAIAMILCAASFASAQLTPNSIVAANSQTVSFYQFKPPHFNAANKYPLIIALHGVGETGDGSTSTLPLLLTTGIPMLLNNGTSMEFLWQGSTQGFVVLAPQLNKNLYGGWQNFYIDEMIAYGINNLNVDPNRVFLTGYSMGGDGCWAYATSSVTSAKKLAGIIPISAGNAGGNYCNIAQNQVATWAFHSADDNVYPPSTSIIPAINSINSCSPLLVPAVDTIYPDGAHAIWNPRVYDPSNKTHFPNIYQWMLDVNRSTNVASNHNPVASINGGSTIILNAPVKGFYLDGSGSNDPDANDLIMDYYWQQTSSPTSVVLDSSQWPKAKVSPVSGVMGLVAGTYTYHFRVKDYLSHATTATVNVIVQLPASGHAAPVTDAGNDIIMSPTIHDTAIIGRASDLYNGGGLSSYNWRQLSGPTTSLRSYNNVNNPYTPGAGEVRFTNLIIAGTYSFEFSATNNAGDIGSDTVNIFVPVQGALPLSIINFSGHSSNSSDLLSWQTSFETNVDHFEILRGDNGNDFARIGIIGAKGGTFTANYSFEDKSALAGIGFYKLMAVDKDGRQTYSPVITVNNNTRKYSIEKFPNPVKDNLTVTINGNLSGTLHVTITDMLGKILTQQEWIKSQGGIRKTISVNNFQNGLYQLMITFPDGSKEISGFLKN